MSEKSRLRSENADNKPIKAPEIPKEDREKLEKLGNDFIDRKQTEHKEIVATKEWLFRRSSRKYPMEIKINEDETRIFYGKRMTEKDRAKMVSVQRRLSQIDPAEMTDEEFDMLQKQGYELLEIGITEPQLSKEEWENVDLALIQKLLEGLNTLQYETDDAKTIDDLRNL